MILPDPLIGAEVDLREFDYMPLYGKRLFTSETWINADAEEKVAALRLWWASWHEEPAGSLPNNDRMLAELAGYGVAIKAFQAIKEKAMNGWIECSDGRLYHPIVCEIAEDSWKGKKKKTEENERDRARKAAKRSRNPAVDGSKGRHLPAENTTISAGHHDQDANISGGKSEMSAGQAAISTGMSAGIPPENALKGREEKGREERKEERLDAAQGFDPPQAPPLGVATNDGQPDFLTTESHDDEPDTQPRTTRRGSRLAPNWRPDQSLMAFAIGLGLDAEWELDKFRDYWIAKPGKDACKHDWASTWRNWCRNSAERRSAGGRPGTGHGTNRSGGGGLIAAASSILAGMPPDNGR